jgi:DNA-binding Lrp family transcriptional regulator
MGCLIQGAQPKIVRWEDAITADLAVDRIDLKILARLQAEGRITNQALSDAVGLSPSACLIRVRRLEAAGLILGYHAAVAIERVAPTVVIFAEVTLTRHHPADFAAFEAYALTIPEIVEAAQVSGAFDYLLKVATRDMRAWRELSDRILNSDLGVGKISSHVMMKAAKAFEAFPIGG